MGTEEVVEKTTAPKRKLVQEIIIPPVTVHWVRLLKENKSGDSGLHLQLQDEKMALQHNN